MKALLISIFFTCFFFLSGWFARDLFQTSTYFDEKVGDRSSSQTPDRPLDRYSIENLSKADLSQKTFSLERKIKEYENFTSFKFRFDFLPTLEGVTTMKTSGLINIPEGSNKMPLVLMVRGWAPTETYTHGVGTWRASEFFANNGFITVAPDFLGYADSDDNAANIFESRFQTYTTILTLIKSLDQIPEWDRKNLFIWAHSNGGQIILTALAVTEKNYPTTLWAPVSVFFPYSVLYYTNESVDRGKLIRRELAKFEELYDTEKYSYDSYLKRINAPIQIHQGTNDSAIPTKWTNDLVHKLRALEKDVNYYVYPGADHNLRPDWDTVVQRDLNFFNKEMK